MSRKFRLKRRFELTRKAMQAFRIITSMVVFSYNAYKSRIVLLILKCVPQNPEIKSATANITALQKELNTISMFNEFAKHVKLQRRITKLKDEKKELVKKQAFRTMKIRYLLMTTFYIMIFGSLGSLMWFYRSESVVKVPPHWLWPVSSFFDWFNSIPGSVTVPCWVAISSSASKSFAKHF